MRFLTLVILAVALVGCNGGKDAQLVGHYEPVLTPPPGTSQNEVVQAIAKLSSLYALDLKEGHQFSIPGQQLNGTWEFKDNNVTLTNGKATDKVPASKQMLDMDANGKLTPEGATNVGGGTRFYYEKDRK